MSGIESSVRTMRSTIRLVAGTLILVFDDSGPFRFFQHLLNGRQGAIDRLDMADGPLHFSLQTPTVKSAGRSPSPAFLCMWKENSVLFAILHLDRLVPSPESNGEGNYFVSGGILSQDWSALSTDRCLLGHAQRPPACASCWAFQLSKLNAQPSVPGPFVAHPIVRLRFRWWQ
jgi:hypothetical protein